MKIELGQIFTQIISFLVMLWVMKRYAWKPFLAMLDGRRDKIKAEIEAIEDQKKEIERVSKEYEDKIKNIEAYAVGKTREAVEEGRRKAEDIQNDAQGQARVIIAKAKDDLQKEVLKAKVQLKDELVKITMAATEKLVEANMRHRETRRPDQGLYS